MRSTMREPTVTEPTLPEPNLTAPSATSTRTIVILGPTAGGKSDLAMELARRLNGELVSADSMQVYRGMDIGTAKPTAAERAEIPHHAIDLVDATSDGFTVASWLMEAERAIADIRARGRIPIIVGGTNLYIRAFLEGLDEAPAADAAFRAAHESIETAALYAQLTASDPARAAQLHPNDRRRVLRALEIAFTTGVLASSKREAWSDALVAPRREDLFLVSLDWPAELVNRRINARVRAMVTQGFVEEVEQLRARGGLCMQASGALGYQEFLALPSDRTHPAYARELLAAIESTKIRSRQLAKQQRTWLRRFQSVKPGITLSCDDSTNTALLADACVAALARV